MSTEPTSSSANGRSLLEQLSTRNTHRRRKGSRMKQVPNPHHTPFAKTVSVLLSCSMFIGPLGWAQSLPTGGQVVHGNVNIATSGTSMNIEQATQQAIVNWESFNIGEGFGVYVDQPSVNAAMLSRVIGQDPSQILGTLQANGIFYLVNPNGVYFGEGAMVDVAQLIASALNITDENFLAGKLTFEGGQGDVINQGTIIAKEMAALIGRNVSNLGSITAREAILAAAGEVEIGRIGSGKLILDMTGLMGDVINEGTVDASGPTGGQIIAKGDRVGQFGEMNADGMTGDAGNIDLYAETVVALSSGSVTSASALTTGDGGDVMVLSPASVLLRDGALIEAMGGQLSGDGGFVETSADYLEILGTVAAGAPAGEAGLWLLDPTDVEIRNVATSNGAFGGGNPNVFNPDNDADNPAIASTGTITTALNAGANVTIETNVGTGGNGDITVVDAISASSLENGDVTLTFNAVRNFQNNQKIQGAGSDGLNIVINAGGDVTVSNQLDTNTGSVTSSGVNFSLVNGIIVTDGGDVDISAHTGAVSIGGFGASTGGGSFSSAGTTFTNSQQISSGGGQITLSHTGAATISQQLNATGGGSTGGVDVNADGGITLAANVLSTNQLIRFRDNVTLAGAIQVDTAAGAGNIQFDGTLNEDATGSRQLTASAGTGSLTFGNIGNSDAPSTINASGQGFTFNGTTYTVTGTQSYTVSGGDFAMAAGAPTQFTGNQVSFSGGGDVSLADGTNLGITSTGSGTITLGAIDGASDETVNINAGGGSVTVGNIGTGVAGGINDVTISGTGGITLTGDVVTSANGGTGDVNLSGNVTLADADGTVSITTADGGSDGTITFGGTVNANTAGVEGLALNTGTADITLNSSIGGSKALGDFSLTGNNVTTNAQVTTQGDVAVAATAAVDLDVVNAGAGTIDIDAAGNVTLTTLQTTNATAAAVDIYTTGGAIIDGGDAGREIIANAAGAKVTLRAETGIGNGNALEVQIAGIDATNDTSGGIQIDEADALAITKLVNTTAGVIDVTTAGLTTVGAAGGGVATGDASSVTITVEGDGALAVNDDVASAGGAVTLEADGSVTFSAASDVTSANGNVTITADNDSDSSGSVTMANGTTVGAGTGTIDIDAYGDITLGEMTTTNATTSAVNVDSANGDIGTADGGLTNIVASTGSARVTLTAAGDIGAVTNIFTEAGLVPIKTTANELLVTSGDAGAAGTVIAIQDSASPALASVDAGVGSAGTAFIDAVGNLSVLNVDMADAGDKAALISGATLTIPNTTTIDGDLRLEGATSIVDGGGPLDINATNILFDSGAAATLTITTAGGDFDGTAGGAFSITNDGGAFDHCSGSFAAAAGVCTHEIGFAAFIEWIESRDEHMLGEPIFIISFVNREA